MIRSEKSECHTGALKIKFPAGEFNGKYSVPVEVPTTCELYEWLANIQQDTLKVMQLNAGVLFGKMMSLEELEAYLRPLVDDRKSKTPTFRVRVDTEDVYKYGSSKLQHKCAFVLDDLLVLCLQCAFETGGRRCNCRILLRMQWWHARHQQACR